MLIGSLFSGYGGLDAAVAAHYDATVAWHVEFDKHASAVLAAHFPNVRNYGDVTAVDWEDVEPVDIVTGGYPCQPFSHAGQRRGTNDDRHLWPYVADCLRVLRPRLAVFENVAGHLSLGFDRVLADLAALGFDADWGVVSAAEAGAPHRRERLFIVAGDAECAPEDAQPEGRGSRHPVGESSDDAATDARGKAVGQRPGLRQSEPADIGRGRPDDGDTPLSDVALLPTPAVNDMGAGKTPEQWDTWTAAMRERHGNGNGHGKSLAIEAQRLLPTPNAGTTPNGHGRRGGKVGNGRQSGADLDAIAKHATFGPYSAAIARWETVLGRPAPAPTEPGQNGRPRLSPAFVEWLMGLPSGWVTDVDIPRSAQLKCLGNGVVPAQALLALQLLDGAA